MRVASDFRELARRALSGKWVSAVLTTLVASILGADIMSVQFYLNTTVADASDIIPVVIESGERKNRLFE